MKIILSIIIPHYNVPIFLDKALNSIPLRKDIEVILIDDNSDKNLEELQLILSSYMHPNFIFIKNDSKNKGAGACRNLGLNRASGKWVMFLDSDDILNENFGSILDKYKNTHYETIFFPPSSIEIDYKTISDRHITYTEILKKASNELWLKYRYPIPVSRFFKREFLNLHQIRFEEIIASNDILFSTLVGYYMTSYFITNETFYIILKRQGSLTQNLSKDVFRSRLNAFLNKQYFLRERLSKKDYHLIQTDGYGYFWLALKSGFGPREIFYIISRFKKYQQKLFKLSLINPVKLFKLLKSNQEFKKDKNYKTNHK